MSDAEIARKKALEIASRLNMLCGGGSANPAASSDTLADNSRKRNRWGEPAAESSASSSVANIAAGIAASLQQPQAERKRVKVFIPTDQYPDINFLGILLGPRGVHQKDMEARTGARILLRGKGTNKNAMPPMPDAEEDLHVIIEGDNDSVAKAKDEIDSICSNPVEASRRSALAAAVNGATGVSVAVTNALLGAGGNTSLAEDEFDIPDSLVGLIIGKGGSNIMDLQGQYQCKVQIEKEGKGKVGVNHLVRGVSLRGTSQEKVAHCREHIEKQVSDHQLSQSNGGGGGAAASGPGSAGNDCGSSMACTLQLAIPDDKVGLVIGKGGTTVRRIQEQTGTQVHIPQQPDADDARRRTITISASSMDSAEAARSEIESVLDASFSRGGGAGGGGGGSGPGDGVGGPGMGAGGLPTNVMYFTIPNDKVGAVIGRGGSVIKDIQARTHARIHIPSDPDANSDPPTRTMVISGQGETVNYARYEVERVLSSMEPGGGGPPPPYPGALPPHMGGGGPPPPGSIYGGGPPGGYPPPYGAPPPMVGGYYGAPPPVGGGGGAPPPPHGHGHGAYPSPYGALPPPGYGAPPPPPSGGQPPGQPGPYGYPAPAAVGGPGGPDPYGQPPPGQPQPYLQQPPPQVQGNALPPGQGGEAQAQRQGQLQGQPPPQQQQGGSEGTGAGGGAGAGAGGGGEGGGEEKPMSIEEYHQSFWEYAAYYGEDYARSQYGEYAPPAGTPPPPGITLPDNPAPPPS